MDKIQSQSKREFWQQHINAWRSSGLLQSAYSRQHHINATTFNNWLRRERKETTINSALPLTPVPVAIQSSKNTSPASSINLQHHRGWQLSLPSDVPVTWLASLLNELA